MLTQGLCKRPKYIPHFYLRISYPPMISILFVQLGFRGDNMRNTNLQAMIESAILGLRLGHRHFTTFNKNISNRRFHFICYDSYFYYRIPLGLQNGFLRGLIWGLLQIVVGDAIIVTPIQVLIEYFVAFAFIGFAGLFYRPIQKHF